MAIEFDESDQAAIIGFLFAVHLQNEKHNGKPDPNCGFCKAFIIDNKPIPDEQHLISCYSFLILDVSENGN